MAEYKNINKNGANTEGNPESKRKNENKKVDPVYGSVGEALTRAALEELFPGEKFTKTRRLEWLSPLELDGYNDKLKFGFEYHGEQHFREIPFFHRTPNAFERQKDRDARKYDLCVQHLYGFVVVTYETPIYKIRQEVRKQVEDMGYLHELGKSSLSDEKFVETTLKNSSHSKIMLEQVKELAKTKGGECLSEWYIDTSTPMKFKCREEHIFWQTYSGINYPDHKGPRFCTICGGTKRREDDEIKEQVEGVGYKFIQLVESPIIDGRPRRKMRIACPAGHEYEILLDNFLPVVNNTPRRQCMTCQRTRINGEKGKTEREQQLELFGLRALEDYSDRHKAVLWECIAQSHQFTTSYNTIVIRKGGKCMECKGKKNKNTRKDKKPHD